VLTQALAMYDSLAQRIGECDAKTQALLAPLVPYSQNLGQKGKDFKAPYGPRLVARSTRG